MALQVVWYLARVEWAEFRHRPVQVGMRLVQPSLLAAMMGIFLAQSRRPEITFGPLGFAPIGLAALVASGPLVAKRIRSLWEQEMLAPHEARDFAMAAVFHSLVWVAVALGVFVLSFFVSVLLFERPTWARLDPVSSVLWLVLDVLVAIGLLQSLVARHFCWRSSGWKHLLGSTPGALIYVVASGASVLTHLEQVAGTPLVATAQALFYACVALALLVNIALWAMLRHQAVPERIIIEPLKLNALAMRQLLRE